MGGMVLALVFSSALAAESAPAEGATEAPAAPASP